MLSTRPFTFFSVAQLLLLSGAAHAATLTYAGTGMGAAPCNTTLQACITGAAPGDTIEIATNAQIDESLQVTQSLTLTSAAGFTGNIGSSTTVFQSLTVTDPAGTVAVTIENLTLARPLYVDFSTGTADAFTVQNCTTADFEADWSVPVTLSVIGNQIAGLGGGNGLVYLSARPASGTSTVQVVANQLSGAPSSPGVDLTLEGSGDVNLLVASNVVHDVTCGCGLGAALGVDARTTGTSTVDIFNNTVDALTNESAIDVAGAPTSGTLTANIFNNIITNATKGISIAPGSNLTTTIDYNDVYQAPNDLTGATYGSHNLAVDPQYVSQSLRNYVLVAGSPAIGAGTLQVPGQLPSIAYGGEPRVASQQIDMGAYQSGQADLGVAISANPLAVATGQNVTLTTAVTNASPNGAPAAVLTVTLPPGLLYSQVSTPQGSCSGVSTIRCNLGAIGAGAGVNVSVIATAIGTGPQLVEASVTDTDPDPNPANNAASVTVTLPSPQDGGLDGGAGPDAGSSSDAGLDGGLDKDAGSSSDAGMEPDAGSPDGGTKASSGGCSCNSVGSDALVSGVPLFCLALALRCRRRERPFAAEA